MTINNIDALSASVIFIYHQACLCGYHASVMLQSYFEQDPCVYSKIEPL